MTELDGVVVLLLIVIAALIWLGSEARKLNDSVESLTESRLGHAITSV